MTPFMSDAVSVGSGGLLFDDETFAIPKNDDPIVLYVDTTIGNDSYDGLAATVGGGHGPKKTWAGIRKLVPFIWQRDYIVKIADGTYSERFEAIGQGPGSLVVIGGVKVEQTGTITSLATTGLNPCGLNQMTMSWDGGFNLTDLVDDEKFIRVSWGDGTYQIMNLYSVLSSVPGANVVETGAIQSGKAAGDYAGKTVELVTPSVIFKPSGASGVVAEIAPQAVGMRTDFYSGIGLWGLEFDPSLSPSMSYVMRLEEFSGRAYASFVRCMGGTKGGLYATRMSGAFMVSASLYALLGTAGRALLPSLSGGHLRASSTGFHSGAMVVQSNPTSAACLALNSLNGGQFTFYGMMKGYIRADNVLSAQVFLYGAIVPSSVMALQWYRSRCLMGISGLVRTGHFTFWGCVWDAWYGNTALEMRAITLGQPIYMVNSKWNGTTRHLHAITISHSVAGPAISYENSEDSHCGDLTIAAQTLNQRAIRMLRSKLDWLIGTWTFPTQDYGNGNGIILMDEESELRFEGTATGKNMNATVSDPIILRRGSRVTAKTNWNLQDAAGAKKAIVGALGSQAVPGGGSTVADVGEFCRFSTL